MNSLPPHRAKLRTVTLMLMAWVFALVAGIANACVLHDRQAGHDGQVESSSEAPAHPDESTNTCMESWDAGASTVAKLAGQDGTGPHGGPAALQSCVGCLDLASASVVRQSLDDGVLAHGPPGAIRFLRLRL